MRLPCPCRRAIIEKRWRALYFGDPSPRRLPRPTRHHRWPGRQKPPKHATTVKCDQSPDFIKMAVRNSNAMRVSGGDARGTRLKGPVVAGVRPTTERVRAAIFNILNEDQVLGCRVLDLFAGTGSLGIEALSRGAAWADFVERNRRQSRDLQDNLDRAGYTDAGRVHCAEVFQWLRQAVPDGSAPYDLALLDPPYRMGNPGPMLAALDEATVVRPGGSVIVGHSSREELPEMVGSLRQYDRRRYGDNAIAFYGRRPSEPDRN